MNSLSTVSASFCQRFSFAALSMSSRLGLPQRLLKRLTQRSGPRPRLTQVYTEKSVLLILAEDFYLEQSAQRRDQPFPRVELVVPLEER